MKLFDVEKCANCNKPVQLVPLGGWVHVNPFDNIDCDEAEG